MFIDTLQALVANQSIRYEKDQISKQNNKKKQKNGATLQ